MPSHRFSPFANRLMLVLGVFTFASWTLVAALLMTWAPVRATAQRTVARVTDAWPAGREQVSDCANEHFKAPRAVEVTASSAAFAYEHESGEDGEGFSWSITGGEPDSHTNPRDARFRFTMDGEDYVVRDPAIVAEAIRVTAPMRKLGREMGRLGAEMGRHGAEMGRLGAQMGAAGARLAALQARLAWRNASHEASEEARAEIQELRDELARMREELGDQRVIHADRQRELSRRMSVLSARQREATREARERVRELARRALREGKAERPHANA